MAAVGAAMETAAVAARVVMREQEIRSSATAASRREMQARDLSVPSAMRASVQGAQSAMRASAQSVMVAAAAAETDRNRPWLVDCDRGPSVASGSHARQLTNSAPQS